MSESSPRVSLEAAASRWLIPVCAAIGLLIGMLVFAFRSPVYEAEATVSLSTPLVPIAEEAAIITTGDVLIPAGSALGFAPNIDVSVNQVASFITIRAEAGGAEMAASAANTVAETYRSLRPSVNPSISNAATVPDAPFAPNRLAHVLLGSLFGALAGGLIVGVRSVTQILPERTSTERPTLEPIRPAVAPSAELHALAGGDPLDDLESALDRSDRPDRPGLTTQPAGPFGRQMSDDLGEQTLAWHDPQERPASDVRIVEATEPATTTFASAASSMVETPPERPSIWGDDEPDVHVEPVAAISDPVLAHPEPAIVITDPAAAPVAAVERPRPTTPGAEPAQASPPSDLNEPIADWIEADAIGQPTSIAAPDSIAQPDVHEPTPAEELTMTDDEPATTLVAPSAADDAAPTTNPPVNATDADADPALAARLSEQALEHAEQMSTTEADYEREMAELKRQLADARKQGRIAAAQVKRMAGDDQHRIGDLEAQATALEAEISTLRTQLERERITHLKELTNERDAADRALDTARRDFQEKIDQSAVANRRLLAENRSELDGLLAAKRAEHQTGLDRQHRDYDEALNTERERHRTELTRSTERHRSELAKALRQVDEETNRNIQRTKDTISSLRATEKRLTKRVDELETAERQYRAELTSARKQNAYGQQKHTEVEQSLRDDLASAQKALAAEKERNAALRDDVVRRTAEAHHAVDRAIEDRSAQLNELEDLVNRQRQHAEERVREVTTAAEERDREAARREAELTARITRLERELDQARSADS